MHAGSSLKPTLAWVGLAIAVAWGHRAWVQADPCHRLPPEQLSRTMAELSERHEQQRRATEAAHDLALALRLSHADPAQRVALEADSGQAYLEAMSRLANTQRDEFMAECHRLLDR